MGSQGYKLKIKKYKQDGDVAWEYNPLRNLRKPDGSIGDFRVKNKDSRFNINLESPMDIECQESYDGTVNLIINDDINPPRLINTRWTRTENDTYRIIERDQINHTNIYDEGSIDSETRLFQNSKGVVKIDLIDVVNYGKMKVGNYIFYMKYMDEDFNETDIIAQSGVISIFNGDPFAPRSVFGGIMDMETNKAIKFHFSDLDTNYSFFKLYVYRTSSDVNGIKLDYAYKIDTDYPITNKDSTVTITGFETFVNISVEELNIQYNIVDNVKTQAQVQNMLFLANVEKNKDYDGELQEMSLYIKPYESQSENIGFVDPKTYSKQSGDDYSQVEYYSPLNIYYKLGYWPDEIYRFGIVYIYNNDKLSPVYNLRGCDFNSIDDTWFSGEYDLNEYYKSREENSIPTSTYWINKKTLSNTRGVFKFNKNKFNTIINGSEKTVNPLGIGLEFPVDMISDLHSKGIKGFFIVRQNRIPGILCQGYAIGVDDAGYYPMLKIGDKYQVESFKNKSNILVSEVRGRLFTTDKCNRSGLLCVDSYLNKQLQSMFDTSEFYLDNIYDESDLDVFDGYRAYSPKKIEDVKSKNEIKSSLIFLDIGVPQKSFKNYTFSTKAGTQEDLKNCSYFDKKDANSKDAVLIRGNFTSFIGSTSKLNDGQVYNIRKNKFSGVNLANYFEVIMDDKQPFYSVSERYCISPAKNATDYDLFKDYAYPKTENELVEVVNPSIVVYGGDCFTNTVTTRLQYNFISSSVPINDHIIDGKSWKDHFTGVRSTTDWDKINKADVDAVPIGTWITYKCLSNFNLSLRCVDDLNVDEMALMGNARSFYPLNGRSLKSSNKIQESNLMNSGYNSLLGVKRNFAWNKVPYVKDIFDTRIMFSNIQVDGEFKNSYKIFQGLSYEDIDRQYGSITKILPWGVNLFCVFEHGLAIIPVNEKALLQTTEGVNIHMYGAGVLQKQVVLISDCLGSIWKDSIVRTPNAIYGVDTHTHKIWKYSDSNKLEIISDFKMQRFLHDEIDLTEYEKYAILGVRNVSSHYNAFKGDIMFTYYNDERVWNICYNEQQSRWITRYSWIPYMSANIDYSMFSFDSERTKIFGIINTNLGRTNRECITVNYNYDAAGSDATIGKDHDGSKSVKLSLNMIKPYEYYNIDSIVVKAFYYDKEWKCDILSDNYDIINNKSKISGDFIKFDGNSVGSEGIIEFNIDRCNKEYLYYIIDVSFRPYVVITNNNESEIAESDKIVNYSIGLIQDSNNINLRNSIYIHGRSFNAEEVDYNDDDFNNQCLPTKWYGKQHPFEFEIVVNEPKGVHKIFDNLMIVSNNVEPNSLEVEITGDVYGLDKKSLYKDDNDRLPIIDIDDKISKTCVKWDNLENSYSLLMHQDSMNIKKYGRRLGNIYYNEDKWYMTLKPIYFRDVVGGSLRSVRLRDKYAKIRVKYSGEQLAIILALQTLYTESYV